MSAAEDAGADTATQLTAGAASAAISWLTENLSNIGPLKDIYGEGFLQKLAPGLAQRLTSSPVGTVALGFLGEGGEEILEDVLDTVATKLIYDPNAAIDPEEALYDGLVGGIIGAIGGGVEVVNKAPSQGQRYASFDSQSQAVTGQTKPEVFASQSIEKSGVTDGVTADKKTAPRMEVVRADTSLFDRGILNNLNQARKSFLNFARQHFPSVVENTETGKTIKISRNGLDKFLSGRLPFEKYATGFHIPELVERAHKVGEATDAKGRIDILGYEYYESPISVNGVDYMAYIRVRNTTSGDSYYGHTIGEIEDIRIEPSARAATKDASQPVNAIDDSTLIPTLSQPESGVKGKSVQLTAEQSPQGGSAPASLTAEQRNKIKVTQATGGGEQQIGSLLKSFGPEVTQAIINEGLQYAPDSESGSRARRLQEKLNAGEQPTGAELARLYQANE